MQVSISDINDIINKEALGDGSLIAALEEIQERYRYLPPEALILASERLGVPLSQTRYRLTLGSGETVSGKTDSDGRTQRIKTAQPQVIKRVELFPLAAPSRPCGQDGAPHDAPRSPEEEAKRRFGHMLEAFRYGAPPHGGIACGIDRWAMLLTHEKDIREVTAFPTTSGGRTAVMEAPSEVDPEQLRELGMKIESANLTKKKS